MNILIITIWLQISFASIEIWLKKYFFNCISNISYWILYYIQFTHNILPSLLPLNERKTHHIFMEKVFSNQVHPVISQLKLRGNSLNRCLTREQLPNSSFGLVGEDIWLGACFLLFVFIPAQFSSSKWNDENEDDKTRAKRLRMFSSCPILSSGHNYNFLYRIKRLLSE